MGIVIAIIITFVITSIIWFIPYNEVVKENKNIKSILEILK